MISRRSFIASSLAATALPMPALASYKPDAFVMDTWRSLKDSTTPVIFNFRASWSHTCEIKADILDAILCEGDRYSDLSIVEVDWDTFGPSQMAERLKVRPYREPAVVSSPTAAARWPCRDSRNGRSATWPTLAAAAT